MNIFPPVFRWERLVLSRDDPIWSAARRNVWTTQGSLHEDQEETALEQPDLQSKCNSTKLSKSPEDRKFRYVLDFRTRVSDHNSSSLWPCAWRAVIGAILLITGNRLPLRFLNTNRMSPGTIVWGIWPTTLPSRNSTGEYSFDCWYYHEEHSWLLPKFHLIWNVICIVAFMWFKSIFVNLVYIP